MVSTVMKVILVSIMTLSLGKGGEGKTAATEVYHWVKVDYDWPSQAMKQDYINTGKYVVENNIIAGLKIYRDEVYVTVPRWRHGVPSTLNRVVIKDGKALVQPFPSWSYQTLNDCTALQYVQSMEVDPNTGLMWIIDAGRVHFLDDIPATALCPPKLIIYDLENRVEVHRYVFPPEVANPTTCFLNDIALDYVDGRVKFAYITDSSDAKLYVYDYVRDRSYFWQDATMRATLPNARSFAAINGVTMAANFDFLYYSPIDGYGLFQIPTSVLRDPAADFSQHVRRVGTRSFRCGGLAYGQRNLYYGLLDSDGVNIWHVAHDATDTGYANVTMDTVQPLVRNNVSMVWADTLAWDDSGHLWFTVNNLSKFIARTMDFSGSSGPNIYLWKVQVNETSYLSHAVTHPTEAQVVVG